MLIDMSSEEELNTNPIRDQTIHYNVSEKYQKFEPADIKQIYQYQANPAEIACLNIGYNLNIGTIVRTSSLFAVNKIHIIGCRNYDRRGAVGMQNYLPVLFHKASKFEANSTDQIFDIASAEKTLISLSKTHTLVYIEQSSKRIDLKNMNRELSKCKNPPIFVVGSESFGIPLELMNLASLCVEIPQAGVGRSHNVSNALSIVLWEYFRDRIHNFE